MDLSKVATITIACESLRDLLHERTGNQIANADIPEMLRLAIESGVRVLLTDLHGIESLELKLDKEGRFQYFPVA